MVKEIHNLDQIQSVDIIKGKLWKPRIYNIKYNWFQRNIFNLTNYTLVKSPTGEKLFKSKKSESELILKELFIKKHKTLNFIDFSRSTENNMYILSKIHITFVNKIYKSYTGELEEITRMYSLYVKSFTKAKIKIIDIEIN
jgi:hypothetical protein